MSIAETIAALKAQYKAEAIANAQAQAAEIKALQISALVGGEGDINALLKAIGATGDAAHTLVLEALLGVKTQNATLTAQNATLTARVTELEAQLNP